MNVVHVLFICNDRRSLLQALKKFYAALFFDQVDSFESHLSEDLQQLICSFIIDDSDIGSQISMLSPQYSIMSAVPLIYRVRMEFDSVNVNVADEAFFRQCRNIGSSTFVSKDEIILEIILLHWNTDFSRFCCCLPSSVRIYPEVRISYSVSEFEDEWVSVDRYIYI